MKLNLLLIRVALVVISNSNLAAQNCGIPDVQMFGNLQTNTSSTLFWHPVSGATEYSFRYRIRNSGVDYSNPIVTTDSLLTLTGLTPVTNYEFIVQSNCGGDTSAYSTSGWFTTLSASASQQISRGPFIPVPTNNSAKIQWVTVTGCNSEIRYGTSLNSLTEVVNEATSKTKHEINLTNLQPNTKYYYSVGVIGQAIEATANNYFYTPPVNNDSVPLKFWVTGDFGEGNAAQVEVRNAFANYTAGQRVDGWLWLGDNAYASGTDQEFQDNVFDMYPNQFKNIPVFPALGNHDYAQAGYLSSASRGTNFPYFDIFSLPTSSGTEKYYSANVGNVHLIALDSYGSYNAPGSPMYNWLEADLMNNTQQWTVVYFHHAPYSKGSHDSDDSEGMVDMRQNIVPLLESYGVDLVLSGHSHDYERSYFMKGHYGTESTFNSSYMVQPGGTSYAKTSRTGNGTVYVVCGVASKAESPVAGWPHNAMFYSTSSKLGSLILDFQGGNFKCTFLSSTGTIADEFTMTKPEIVPNTTVVSEASVRVGSFEISPNPAKDEFNIYTNNVSDKIYTVKIYNQIGQVVFDKAVEVNNNNKIISINKDQIRNCVPGVYFVSLMDDRSTESKMLMIE